MNITWKSSLIVALAACTLWADQVTLKNGDRVTGTIVKKEGNSLTVKSDLMGVITLPWDQITDIKSATPLNVVLADRTVQSTLESRNGQIKLSGDQSVAPAGVLAIRDAAEQTAYERLLHPGILQLWTGTTTLGLAGTRGNAQTTTLNLALHAARTTNHDSTAIYFNAVKSSASVSGVSSDTAQASRGGWSYNRTVRSRLDVNTFNDYEYDRFQSLDLRFVLGAGLGYHLWKNDRSTLALQGGADYEHEKFSPATPAVPYSRSSADAYWGNGFGFKLNRSTSVVQTFRMFNNLSDTGAYRANFDLIVNTTLRKWLVWNLSLSDRYLSTPVAGRKANDMLYTTGIGVTFGH